MTITGTGFQSGAAVTIGGTAATSVTVVSSTSITAKTPAHAAGAADVAVKNTDNQSGALSGGYTYTSSSGGGSGAPAGATFYDDFSKGSLDTSKWIPSNWNAPGGGSFVPSYLDFSTGMLRIKVTQSTTRAEGSPRSEVNCNRKMRLASEPMNGSCARLRLPPRPTDPDIRSRARSVLASYL